MCRDAEAFCARLRGPLRGAFDGDAPIVIARAPGRLDAFGGIIDYTGGTVCEMPTAQATWVALQPRADRLLRVRSLGIERDGLQPEVVVALDDLVVNGDAREYAAVREAFGAEPTTSWVRYVIGAWPVLARELGAKFEVGANLVIESDVPLGAGVSSSAALEMATLWAVVVQRRLAVDPKTLARLGQIVENRVVGAPCGLMDQLTVTLGTADALLVIRCQPDELLGPRRLPPGVTIGAIDTGVKHSVGGRRYSDARAAAFMGHKLILDHLRGLGSVGPGEDPFCGYLARVPRDEYLRIYRPLLPARLRGRDFLARWGETVDTATRIDPDTDYRVLGAVEHHVLENARTPEFLEALESYGRTRAPEFLVRAGELMLASHASYRDNVGLGADEADLMVELAMERGPANGVYGAKITGGGSGGSVAILGDERLPGELTRIAAAYRERSGERPQVLVGSSDGAAAWGHRELLL